MKPAELLTPQFKFVADYPFNNHFTVGEVLSLIKDKDGVFVIKQPELTNRKTMKSFMLFTEEYLLKYPKNFKILNWWEEREKKNMPKYMKDNHDGQYVLTGIIHFSARKIDTIDNSDWQFIIESTNSTYQYYNFEPATKAEYDAYKKNKKK